MLINEDELLERCGGDGSFVQEVIDDFLQLIPDMMTPLREAFDSGDLELIEQAAHSIKGASGNLSAMPLQEAAKVVEDCARNGDLECARNGLPKLEEQLAVAIEGLREFQARLGVSS